jgi:uncharacterized membrane protein
MDTVVAELVSFLQALKSGGLIGYLILLAFVLIVLALVIVIVYQRIVIKRLKTASKAAQEKILETMAVNLRKRALEMNEPDDDLRKRELEVRERDELNGNAELRSELRRPGQQQALKESVSHAITLGFKDIQTRLLQTDFKGMMSAVPDSLKADLQWNPDEAPSKIQNRIENLAGKRVGKEKK